MKHYMDISRIKSNNETELTQDNTGCFEVGDIIQISEKIDGANASIALDDDGNLVAFSRKNKLSYDNNLRGFWNYVQGLDKDKFQDLGKRVCYGEWLCLSGDTIIRKTSGGKNANYITIRDMYRFLNEPTDDKYHYNPNKGNHSILTYLKEKDGQTFEELLQQYKKFNEMKKMSYKSSLKRIISYNTKRNYIDYINNKYFITEVGLEEINDYRIRNNWWNRYGMPSIYSLYHNQDVIMPNKVLNIVYTGDKDVYEVKTRLGYTIKTTLEHKFYTPNGYIPLKELKLNDCVGITTFNNQRNHRRLGQGARNILSAQEQYKKKIGKCEICNKTNCLELHHKDKNYLNNNPDNWQVLCSDCHIEQHKNDNKFTGFVYGYIFDNIIEISHAGIEDCYDIEMCGDKNCANFVANNFIVHNCKHTVKYDADAYNNWYVYDIYDTETEQWLPQSVVKEFAESHGLKYVHVLYEGEFISWEHCKTFMNSPAYGDNQEGIVVKNQTKINNPNIRQPFYLKIVNESFSETKVKNHIQKVIDPQLLAEQKQAEEMANQVVTKERVIKEINKMIDEGILPDKLQSKDMGTIAKNLPSRIFHDLIKEEIEFITIGNKYFGKAVNAVTLNYARQIVLGG